MEMPILGRVVTEGVNAARKRGAGRSKNGAPGPFRLPLGLVCVGGRFRGRAGCPTTPALCVAEPVAFAAGLYDRAAVG